MTLAAIYARKSTEQAGVGDEAKSVTRQVAHAREYAERKGWTVAEEHVYVDDGVSGAEFATRAGFVRLMNALKPRAPFQVLVMAEESRLGREQIEVAYALKQLVQAGVRVWLYLENRERTLDSPLEKFLMSATSFADELERDKARQRTYDALLRRARAGHVTGGVVFGYDNRPVVADPAEPNGPARRLHVERVLNAEESAVVRRIFELCAAGVGIRRIAHRLNEDHALAPVPRRSGRSRSWAPSTVREVLFRDLYRGRLVWGRLRKRDHWGRKKYLERPADDWTVLDVPHLRIVPEELWVAAHARLAEARRLYLRATDGVCHGRPPASAPSKYLLVGLAACACCGGGFVARSRDYGRVRRYTYVCGYAHNRGRTVCGNTLEAPMPETNRAVLLAFAEEVLHPEVVRRTMTKALAALTETNGTLAERRRRLQERARAVEVELARLAQAIAAGGPLGALVGAIGEREREREAIGSELAGLGQAEALRQVDVRWLQREVSARLTAWQGLLGKQPEEARAILRELLAGRLIFRPHIEGPRRYYEFTGQVSLGRIISGVLNSMALVTPAGFEPAISTLKGSRPGPG